MGVVTMAERHGGKSVTRQIFDAMIDEVLPFIDDFAKRVYVAVAGMDGRFVHVGHIDHRFGGEQLKVRYRPFLVLVVGYPAEGATVPTITKKSLHEFVTFVTG